MRRGVEFKPTLNAIPRRYLILRWCRRRRGGELKRKNRFLSSQQECSAVMIVDPIREERGFNNFLKSIIRADIRYDDDNDENVLLIIIVLCRHEREFLSEKKTKPSLYSPSCRKAFLTSFRTARY